MGGILNLTGGPPPQWFPYFQVADIDHAIQRGTSLGGKSPMPVMQMPDMRFAILNDPQGAAFGLMQRIGAPLVRSV